MMLANVAWILASNGKKVLTIDWDLEAPGLHRYFYPFLVDKDSASSDGVINFVTDYKIKVMTPPAEGNTVPDDWYIEYANIKDYASTLEWDFQNGGRLDFVSAGRQDGSYSTLVNLFNWQDFYERLGGKRFLDEMKKKMREDYEYVLIDSRTGVSDTSGICTVHLPDNLVVCFTLNYQSINGASTVATTALEQRNKLGEIEKLEQKDSPNVESLESATFDIFPLQTRIENAEKKKLELRRDYARQKFSQFPLALPGNDKELYWENNSVLYEAYYAYEELLAAFGEKERSITSLLAAAERLASYLTKGEVTQLPTLPQPRREEILAVFEGRKTRIIPTDDLIQMAERTVAALNSEQRNVARRVLLRLVRVARREERGEHTRLRVSLKEFTSEAISLLRSFAQSGLLSIEREKTGEEMVELSDEALIRGWPRLSDWIEQDFDFLLWRQKHRDLIQAWENSGRKDDYLLRGDPLKNAEMWLNNRSADLSSSENEFIEAALIKSQIQDASPSDGSGVSVFIIRPFGVKKGINFDRVESELITPALVRHGIVGRTTGDSLRQGNIRTEVFQRLITADMVIVDISISNANVFYELGIRHALRMKRTFFISCGLLVEEIPFDLKTDRYFSYDPQNPGGALDKLTMGLRQTLMSQEKDSPVFQLLPYLEEPDKSRFLVVPSDFQEEVEFAANQNISRNQWGDLKLLQTEIRGFPWEVEGLKVIGRAQFSKRSYEYARDTLEAVRKYDPNDKEANILLGTTYQRLGDLTGSNKALQRVLKDKSATQFELAEAHSLIGRNLKERWKAQWVDLPVDERQTAALHSMFLKESYEEYKNAFMMDLNHYYSGINALSMLTIITEIATALPEVWNEGFEDEDEAERQFKKIKEELEELRGSVTLSIKAENARLKGSEKSDIWFNLTLADLAFLTSKRPQYVANQYRATLVGAEDFVIDAARRQLDMYAQLGVIKDNVVASLNAIPVPDIQEGLSEKPPYILLFKGHRIDSPTRKEPRFPASKENRARRAIKDAVEKELNRVRGQVIGIAGGASGGDILFHEVCAELNIPTTLYLVMPREEYVKESVLEAGPEWMDRFNALYGRLQRRELSDSNDLPRWLQNKPNYSIWNRNNLWMLYNAMARGSQYVTLIALWDGEAGDGLGGAKDMVNRAGDRGAKTIILNIKDLFDT